MFPDKNYQSRTIISGGGGEWKQSHLDNKVCTHIFHSWIFKSTLEKNIYSFCFNLYLAVLGIIWQCIFGKSLSSHLLNKQIPYLEHSPNFLLNYFVPSKKMGVLVCCTFHIDHTVIGLFNRGRKITRKIHFKWHNEALFSECHWTGPNDTIQG